GANQEPSALPRDTLTRPLSLARERRPLRRAVRCSRNDSRHPSRFAGCDCDLDFLFRALFRSGDRAVLAQATSIASSGSESSRTHQIHTTLPEKSAPRSKRPAAGRRTRERCAGGVVSFFSVGGAFRRTHSAVVGWNCDLCRGGAVLRFHSKTPGAFGALQTLGHRRPDVANSNAASRSHGSWTGAGRRLCR